MLFGSPPAGVARQAVQETPRGPGRHCPLVQLTSAALGNFANTTAIFAFEVRRLAGTMARFPPSAEPDHEITKDVPALPIGTSGTPPRHCWRLPWQSALIAFGQEVVAPSTWRRLRGPARRQSTERLPTWARKRRRRKADAAAPHRAEGDGLRDVRRQVAATPIRSCRAWSTTACSSGLECGRRQRVPFLGRLQGGFQHDQRDRQVCSTTS